MSSDGPLLELLSDLKRRNYQFTALTPATHARVLSRVLSGPPTLRDIFGWNRSFVADDLDGSLLALLQAADLVETTGNRLRSKVRVASLDEWLFVHSSFPTNDTNSVFFGPDTYRFTSFVRRQLRVLPSPTWIVDMGAGTGAGGIIARQLSGNGRTTLVDVNPAALRLARINAALAGITVETLDRGIPGGADLVIANPPYMMDLGRRAYRDGGSLLGGAIALDWAQQALANMPVGAAMLLYTGVAYSDGSAPLLDALHDVCVKSKASLSIEELDPDVFGEELDNEAYAQVERIAAVGAVIMRAS